MFCTDVWRTVRLLMEDEPVTLEEEKKKKYTKKIDIYKKLI